MVVIPAVVLPFVVEVSVLQETLITPAHATRETVLMEVVTATSGYDVTEAIVVAFVALRYLELNHDHNIVTQISSLNFVWNTFAADWKYSALICLNHSFLPQVSFETHINPCTIYTVPSSETLELLP